MNRHIITNHGTHHGTAWRTVGYTDYELKYLSAGASYARSKDVTPPKYAAAIDGRPNQSNEALLFWDGFYHEQKEIDKYAHWQPA